MPTEERPVAVDPGVELPMPAPGERWTAGAVVRNPDGEVFLQRRSPHCALFPDTWDVAGGHVEPGETVLEALGREIAEETGWRLRRVRQLLGVSTWTGDDGKGLRHEADFLVEVDGDLTAPALDPAEHSSFGWFGPADLARLEEHASPVELPLLEVIIEALNRGAGALDTGTQSSPPPALPSSPGLIIFLNGASSSGKSSIARKLLPLLEESYFHMPVDAFHAMRSGAEIPPDELQTAIDRAVMGFHRAVAGMAASGNNVVVDHLFSRRWRLLDCLSLFDPGQVFLVGVQCPLEVLESRERARGDRPSGLAARQFAQVHSHGRYDLVCDTSRSSPQECARRIADLLPRRPRNTAFERLRRDLLPSPV